MRDRAPCFQRASIDVRCVCVTYAAHVRNVRIADNYRKFSLLMQCHRSRAVSRKGVKKEKMREKLMYF